jgi:sarcosine oxidase subunit alpha
VDFDDAAFPFMSYREGTVAGVAARIFRISFSGERSYEVNVPSAQGLQVWEAIHAAGAEFGITPYGTETMHVLRAEKGFIIVGQDTDGSVTPVDLGIGRRWSPSTKDLPGQALAQPRSDTARADRKQLVGLLTDEPQFVLPEGAQVLQGQWEGSPVPMAGHVTSSYWSPTLKRSVAMALVRGGLSRMGERVHVAMRDGRSRTAVITSPVFYDPKGERQNAC